MTLLRWPNLYSMCQWLITNFSSYLVELMLYLGGICNLLDLIF